MNLIEIFRCFPDQQACIDHLESIRFKDGAYCPHCGSTENVKRSLKSTIIQCLNQRGYTRVRRSLRKAPCRRVMEIDRYVQ